MGRDGRRQISMLEKVFENTLWSSRFIIILAVVFGLIGAVVLFAVASVDIFVTAKYVLTTYINHAWHLQLTQALNYIRMHSHTGWISN